MHGFAWRQGHIFSLNDSITQKAKQISKTITNPCPEATNSLSTFVSKVRLYCTE